MKSNELLSKSYWSLSDGLVAVFLFAPTCTLHLHIFTHCLHLFSQEEHPGEIDNVAFVKSYTQDLLKKAFPNLQEWVISMCGCGLLYLGTYFPIIFCGTRWPVFGSFIHSIPETDSTILLLCRNYSRPSMVDAMYHESRELWTTWRFASTDDWKTFSECRCQCLLTVCTPWTRTTPPSENISETSSSRSRWATN